MLQRNLLKAAVCPASQALPEATECKFASCSSLISKGCFAEVADPATEEETLVLSKLEEMALEELMRMLEHQVRQLKLCLKRRQRVVPHPCECWWVGRN